MIDKRFGQLTVIELADNIKFKLPTRTTCWICQCDCGSKIIMSETDLKWKIAANLNCGCSQTKFVNISGQRFGNLTVLFKTIRPTGKGQSYWLCKCDCGAITSVSSGNLRYGKVHSCGCSRLKY